MSMINPRRKARQPVLQGFRDLSMFPTGRLARSVREMTAPASLTEGWSSASSALRDAMHEMPEKPS